MTVVIPLTYETPSGLPRGTAFATYRERSHGNHFQAIVALSLDVEAQSAVPSAFVVVADGAVENRVKS